MVYTYAQKYLDVDMFILLKNTLVSHKNDLVLCFSLSRIWFTFGAQVVGPLTIIECSPKLNVISIKIYLKRSGDPPTKECMPKALKLMNCTLPSLFWQKIRTPKKRLSGVILQNFQKEKKIPCKIETKYFFSHLTEQLVALMHGFNAMHLIILK